ncbi:hypothetical protein [Schlesneria paludicola]|uniref:hypothetical protein n=1 Tax=Schlesneria paludicola TaxID=360056 RepID=UPI00029A9BFA|nr:hypothetical protein [Schlesneria paludicola]
MNRETLIWTILFVAGAGFLALQSATSKKGVGQQYVVPVEVVGQLDPTTGVISPLAEGQVADPHLVRKAIRYDRAARDDKNAVWSWSRTIGVWAAALLTLSVFSYLYRDSAAYKFAESIIVGVSAGYAIVLNFWEVIVAKIFVKLSPDLTRYALLPDTPTDAVPDYYVILPVILSCMVFCRLIPKIAWLGRWPLAFVVGTTAGLKLILFLNADFVQQIRSTILPLIVVTSNESGFAFDWKQSIQNIVIVVSVISSLTYFYFSVEHRGIVGRVSRLGIWVLMISFGASFALTVMGRITLLTMRLQFLFNDWLGLVGM